MTESDFSAIEAVIGRPLPEAYRRLMAGDPVDAPGGDAAIALLADAPSVVGINREMRQGEFAGEWHPDWFVIGNSPAGAADVDRAVGAARGAFEDGPWATMPAAARIYAIDLRRHTGGAPPAGRLETSRVLWVFFAIVLLMVGIGAWVMYPARAVAILILASIVIAWLLRTINARLLGPVRGSRPFAIRRRRDILADRQCQLGQHGPLEILDVCFGRRRFRHGALQVTLFVIRGAFENLRVALTEHKRRQFAILPYQPLAVSFL